ncbi:MAG TPA: winged helix-turn-helix domain-containing protein [Candidatus Eisenbacteria bacterium]|nr:winged helix-turn-helix domain-containing protein [Candidatus Eisenbacteria bacterium]
MRDELPLSPLLAEVARLRDQAVGAQSNHPVLDRALTALEQSVEELQVAAEELQVKNEELLLALANLDEERRRYRDLFDLAPDGHLVTDARGVIAEANRAAGELTGRSSESLLGRRLLDLVAPGSRIEAARRLRPARMEQDGETMLDLAAGAGRRLVHARYRRAAAEASRAEGGEARVHWTLTDLERPVFEAELATRDDPVLIRRWLSIYGELVTVAESLLEGMLERAETVSRGARSAILESQVRPLEAHLARLARRRDHWSRRHAEVVGLELSAEAGQARYGDRVIQMTPREQQLLAFLVNRPGTFYPSRVLLARAWHASYLSEEQVRTYVGRLRRKLRDLEFPCELVTRRPQGYALVFAEGDGHPPSPSPV